MACIDAPEELRTLLTLQLDAPNETGVEFGVINAPNEVRAELFLEIDAPCAVGVNLYTKQFLEIWVQPPPIPAETGVPGGRGDGTGFGSGGGLPTTTVENEGERFELPLGSGPGQIEPGGWVLQQQPTPPSGEQPVGPNSGWTFTGGAPLPGSPPDDPSDPQQWVPYVPVDPYAGAGSVPASRLWLPDVTFSLTSAVGDLTDYVYQMNYGARRNDMLSGSVTLLHHSNGYFTVPNAFITEGGIMPLDAHNMTQDRVLNFSVQSGGGSRQLVLLPGDLKIDPEGLATLPFTDLTPLLLIEGQHRRSIVAELGDYVLAHEEMRAIGAERGITVECRGWPNYPIRELHMADGNPLLWMDKIAAPFRPCRRWEGTTLVYEVMELGMRSFTLIDRERIESGSWGLNATDVRNSWVSNRMAPQPGQIADPAIGQGRGSLGRTVDIQFITPISSGYVTAQAVFGEIEHFTWFGPPPANDPGALGPELGVGPVYAGLPVVRLQATYRNFQPWPGPHLVPGYEVRVFGSPVSTVNRSRFPITGSFRATLTSPDLITAYGLRPEYRSQDDIIIPDQEMNVRSLEAVRREAELAVVNSDWGTPWVNFEAREGFSVNITDYELRQAGAQWMIDSYRNEMKEPGDWYQSLNCIKPREV